MISLRTPSLDVFEEKDEMVVKADLPGMKKDEIQVTVTENVVTIKGEKKEVEVKEKGNYRRERSYGSFVRSVELPSEVKSDRIKANFKDCVLEVCMPKTEEAKKKSVSVKVDQSCSMRTSHETASVDHDHWHPGGGVHSDALPSPDADRRQVRGAPIRDRRRRRCQGEGHHLCFRSRGAGHSVVKVG